MSFSRTLAYLALGIGLVWALFRLGGEAMSGMGFRRENPEGASFTMTRTFVCRKCGYTLPATPEEITRRIEAGQARMSPETGMQIFICDREGTPTLELVIDAKPKP